MKDMPDVSPNLIQMISSVNMLCMIFMPMVYFKGIDRGARKKTMLLISSVLFVVGGFMPAFMNSNIWIILFWRLISGLGVGLLMPMAGDFAVDFFEGRMRDRLQGIISAMLGISGTIFQLAGGGLGASDWRHAFYAYLLGIPFLLLAYIFVPEPDRKAKMAATEGITENKQRAKLTGSMIFMAFAYCLIYLPMIAFTTNTSIVLVNDGMATVGQIGMIMSVMSLVSIVAGFLFGLLVNRIKTTGCYVILGISAIFGCFVCATTYSVPMFVLAVAAFGIAFGMGMPLTITKSTRLVPYSAGAAAVSMVVTFMGVGGFLQPLIFALLPAVYAVGRGAFLIGGYIAIAGAICCIAGDLFTAKKEVTSVAELRSAEA